MASTIQIKRSAATGTPSSLAAGELAFSNVTGGSGVLFIGSTDGGSVVPIGGYRTPGTLTANQALVANSTSYINEVKAANIYSTGVANLTGIYAYSSPGTPGTGAAQDVLSSNGSGGVYWASLGALGVNTAATYAWTNNHTWDNAHSLSIGNATFNTSILYTGLTVQNGTSTSVINAYGLTAPIHQTQAITTSNGFFANATLVFVGNTSVNATHTPTGFAINGTTTVANASGVFATLVQGTTVNATTANATTFQTGAQATGSNTFYANAILLAVGNGSVNVSLTPSSVVVGTGVTLNATGVWTSGTVNAAVHQTGGGIGATTNGVYINATMIYVGNSTVNSWVNATGIYVNGTTTTVTTTGFNSPAGSVNAASHLTGGGLGAAANGASVNTTSVWVGNATVNVYILTGATSTAGLYINGVQIANSTGANNSFNLGGAAASAYVNTSGNFTLGGNTTLAGTNTNITSSGMFYSSAPNNYFSSNVNIAGSLGVSGNLTVSGTISAIDTVTLQVKDNVIQLADGQISGGAFTDAVDTGMYVAFGNTAAGNTYYAGIARIASLSTNTNPVMKIFSTNVAIGATVIDTGASTGTLRAFLEPWGPANAFVVNSTSITATANATVAVNITANTLSGTIDGGTF